MNFLFIVIFFQPLSSFLKYPWASDEQGIFMQQLLLLISVAGFSMIIKTATKLTNILILPLQITTFAGQQVVPSFRLVGKESPVSTEHHAS
jgi:hypothetical protein